MSENQNVDTENVSKINSKKSILKKLFNAKSQIRKIQSESGNKYAFSSKAEVYSEVDRVLTDNQILANFNQYYFEKNAYQFVTVSIEFICIDTEQSIITQFTTRVDKILHNCSQDFGTATTYAHKYLLINYFRINSSTDIDIDSMQDDTRNRQVKRSRYKDENRKNQEEFEKKRSDLLNYVHPIAVQMNKDIRFNLAVKYLSVDVCHQIYRNHKIAEECVDAIIETYDARQEAQREVPLRKIEADKKQRDAQKEVAKQQKVDNYA